MGKNMTGGDFCGGLPAAEKALLAHRVTPEPVVLAPTSAEEVEAYFDDGAPESLCADPEVWADYYRRNASLNT